MRTFFMSLDLSQKSTVKADTSYIPSWIQSFFTKAYNFYKAFSDIRSGKDAYEGRIAYLWSIIKMGESSESAEKMWKEIDEYINTFDDPDLYLLKAMWYRHYAPSKESEANKCFLDAIERAPKNPLIYREFAKYLQFRNRIPSAIEMYTKALALLDEKGEYHFERGSLQNKVGDRYTSAQAYFDRGKLRQQLGNYAEALEDYAFSRKLFNKKADESSYAKYQTRIDNCIKEIQLEEKKKIQPQSGKVTHSSQMEFLTLNGPSEQEEYERYFEDAHKFIWNWRQHDDLQKRDRLFKNLQKYADLTKSSMAYRLMSDFYKHVFGQAEKAKEYLYIAYEANLIDPLTLYRLAALHFESDPKYALELYDQAFEALGGESTYRCKIGTVDVVLTKYEIHLKRSECYDKLDKPEEALREYRTAREVCEWAPDRVEAEYDERMIKEKIGKYENRIKQRQDEDARKKYSFSDRFFGSVTQGAKAIVDGAPHIYQNGRQLPGNALGSSSAPVEAGICPASGNASLPSPLVPRIG